MTGPRATGQPERGAASATDSKRLLETLERLLELSAADLHTALTHATDLVARALGADKVDAFLYDHARDSLVALSSSNQPLSALQRKHGLDVLPLANGGRTVGVYQTGQTFATGHLEKDPDELRGLKETLRIRSEIGVPLELGGRRRGMMMIASLEPERFTDVDVRFAESVARWVGTVAHRAELVQEIARNSVAAGRRAAAEELITVFAHDMRNHISPIATRLQLLQRRAESDAREFAVRELGLALRALGRLGVMVSDILGVERIDRGVLQVNLQPVEVVALVEDAAATLSTDEHRVLVRAKLAEPLTVAADPERLRQCVENLLSNAVKHSPADAPVTVMITREAEASGDLARIHVIDEGPGVPPEVMPRIFERFATGRAAEGGLGLGLYLARRIAQTHGGDLSLESAPGTGARFILTLPVAAGDQASSGRLDGG